jgi:hypothetical protein
MAISTNPHRKQKVAMKYSVIKHVALFAALVVSTAANAANYDYTEHYDYVRKPQLSNAQIDLQIQEDTVACDNAIGVQQGKAFRRLSQLHVAARLEVQLSVANPDPDLTRASGSLLQLQRQGSARPFYRS